MKQRAKRWVNAGLRRLGVQLVAAREDERQALVDLLHGRAMDNVIDVGANRGQFAQQLLDKGYRGKVHCIEPLEDAHSALAQRFDGQTQVHVLPRTAIGAEDGAITMHVAGNSVSSSARDMLPAHSEAAPRSAYIGEQQVPLAKLDSLLADQHIAGQGMLLKIDTQGFEAEVLAGAVQTLNSCAAVLIEMSTTPLYAGQAMWDELHATLSEAGFELWDLLPDFRDGRTGRLLQFDGLYLRS